jgi:ABC-type Zn uptake system ZnuABC Zn-binding protein ZnuA
MKKLTLLFVQLALLLGACQPPPAATPASAVRILAAETFLQDISQHVAGSRAVVESLLPLGLDPHSFEPTPRDVARLANSTVVIVNGSGFEVWLEKTLANAGGQRLVIEASAGLTSRTQQPGEQPLDEPGGLDPHFWLDPLSVIQYVENIRDGLIQVDPGGKSEYEANTQAYTAQLRELDQWIRSQIDQIPPERRLLVTNHESFGYYADRYGLKIIGTVLQSVSTSANPSARQLANLVDQIKATGAPAIFLETGANPNLADQVAAETGATVVTGLLTHSITAPDGLAPTYIDMMKYNTTQIVKALK